MASIAIDFEQSGALNQHPAVTQASLEYESEVAGHNDSHSSTEDKLGKAWQPEDA
jgi:hypothetical protein